VIARERDEGERDKGKGLTEGMRVRVIKRRGLRKLGSYNSLQGKKKKTRIYIYKYIYR